MVSGANGAARRRSHRHLTMCGASSTTVETAVERWFFFPKKKKRQKDWTLNHRHATGRAGGVSVGTTRAARMCEMCVMCVVCDVCVVYMCVHDSGSWDCACAGSRTRSSSRGAATGTGNEYGSRARRGGADDRRWGAVQGALQVGWSDGQTDRRTDVRRGKISTDNSK